MSVPEDIRKLTMAQAQGAAALHVAFIGIDNGLLDALARGPASAADVAQRLSLDAAYVARWCEAAFAFGYLERRPGGYEATELGFAFLPGAPDTLMPFAVQAVLGAHLAERVAGLMRTGEQPGVRVLADRATLVPWFGPMAEATFGPFFEREVLPAVGAFAEVAARGGVALDLGCGNGWYLHRLVTRFPSLRGVGLDAVEENVRRATERALCAGLGDRLSFFVGDLHHNAPFGPVSLVAMNRSLHPVWDQRERVFRLLHAALEPGGVAVVWEPAWPEDVARLREPRARTMAVQNLAEHVHGNHFLNPAEIEAAFAEVDMATQTFLLDDGLEAIVVGRRAR